MLYGASVWARHMGRKGWTTLDKSNRKIGLRVIAAYRTASKSAVEVLAGLPPTELMAEYRRSTAKAEDKEAAKSRMMQEWQSRWDRADTGRWTYKLIPYLKRWHERKHGLMDYHLTQAFTGHGCFSSYLHRFGKLASPACLFCEDPNYDVKHTVFECDAFYMQRRSIEMTIGKELTPENIVEFMLTSEANWEVVRTHVTKILKRKEEEERERQKQIVVVVQS